MEPYACGIYYLGYISILVFKKLFLQSGALYVGLLFTFLTRLPVQVEA